jgi:hypothetical protein
MSQPKRGWPLRSYRPVRVSGQSMTPSLLDGDVLLVQLRAQVRPGDIVLGRFASLDLPVVKRANRQAAGGWILTSDNSRAGSDSQVYGPAEVAGWHGYGCGSVAATSTVGGRSGHYDACCRSGYPVPTHACDEIMHVARSCTLRAHARCEIMHVAS